jgi:RNA-directed DNA polymerase
MDRINGKYYGFWDDICDFRNVELAYRRARRGVRYKDEVLKFSFNYGQNIVELWREMVEGRWRPGRLRRFVIYEPKRRKIEASSFNDRVVHHAICSVLGPIMEKGMYSGSYACRKGKGSHVAVLETQRNARKYRYVMQCDISKYFASIVHEVLIEMLTNRIGDTEVIDTVRSILKAPGKNRARGLPLGFLTSQLFANVYLTPLDDYVKRTLRPGAYIRYMDDFLVFSNDKKALSANRTAISKRLKILGLKLKNGTGQVFPVKNGIPFLGYRVFPRFILLKKSNIKRFRQRARKSGPNREKMVNGWRSYAKWANVPKLQREMEIYIDD